MSKKRMTPPANGTKLIAAHRKAAREFFIEERIEAGLVLEGWEVKSLRSGKAQLVDSYVLLKDREAWLVGAHISPLPTVSTHLTPDPTRTRKLLLNRAELSHLFAFVDRRGYTVVPTRMYWKKGRAKVEIGIAKGKKQHDKRAVERDRDWQREKARLLKRT